MTRRRRLVQLCDQAAAHPRARAKMWAFDHAALAALFGSSLHTIRRRTGPDGDIDPTDLSSICRAWAAEHWPEITRMGLDSLGDSR